jgi:copper(I)-binding protein
VAIRLAKPGKSRLFAATTALALALTGCAAGQISQTAQQVPAIDGANATAQGIAIRNVVFAVPTSSAYPAGSSVPLKLWVSNTTLATEKLTAVSSPGAGGATISGAAEFPAKSLVEITPDSKISITLTGLKQELSYGHSLPVTFSFATAGPLTVTVPIEIPGDRGTEQRETVNILPSENTNIWFGPEHGATAESTPESVHSMSATPRVSTAPSTSMAPTTAVTSTAATAGG